jgi:hypothetical protein
VGVNGREFLTPFFSLCFSCPFFHECTVVW